MSQPASAQALANLLSMPHDRLEQWLALHGVAAGFIDFAGQWVATPLENRLHMLLAMETPPTSPAQLEAMIDSLEESAWQVWLPPCLVLDKASQQILLRLPETDMQRPLHWRLHLDEGQGRLITGSFEPANLNPVDARQVAGQRLLALEAELPRLPMGYHLLSLSDGGRWQECLLVVSPPTCFEPPWAQAGERIWGIAAQLYAVHSERNWGMGDFSDLMALVERAARQGADFILLNPLHALDLKQPRHCSPYSPSDRRFLNPLYIDPCLEEEFAQSPEAQSCWQDPKWQARRQALAAEEWIDYEGVSQLKLPVLAALYQTFVSRHLLTSSARGRSFQAFIEEAGAALVDFCRCQAMGPWALPHDWPQPLREVLADQGFHAYLQWVARRQLAFCQELSLSRGMKLGLIRDLAVGGDASSCEVRNNPALFCLEASIGAPPDHFNPDGQNWGLPPLRPDHLASSRFQHFIQLLRSNMQHCGALRIDHVMSLMRLWWCPNDGSNADGAYLHYPVEALFAILRLESQRARCLVIGEDLGVVPPEIRAYIDAGRIYANLMFYFEKDDVLQFRAPAHYKQKALAIVTNHDVPPLRGWWNLQDLKLRRTLQMIASDTVLETEVAHRQREKNALLDWLQAQGLLPESWQQGEAQRAYDWDLGQALQQACASGASQLLSVSLDDLAMMESPVNIPGTSSEYANWRRRLQPSLDALFREERVTALMQSLSARRTRQE